MKRLSALVIILIFIGSSSMIFAQRSESDEYADRKGRLRLGADLTVPTLFVSLELTEFLGGPTIHYGLTDTIELKATLAPLVRVSSFLTKLVREESSVASFVAVGLVEAGARFYFTPYKSSWFLDSELVAGFIASDYNFIEDSNTFMFKTAGNALGFSAGYDFGNGFSLEAGAYFITPTLTLGDESFSDLHFIPFPKFSVTYML